MEQKKIEGKKMKKEKINRKRNWKHFFSCWVGEKGEYIKKKIIILNYPLIFITSLE